ncbi:MAG TPA: DUF2474 domain-containing protein [Patescibacteria group bacterium]|nr:DUF2474 domain-containing protein [Patescibacteria group bacterium]
MKTLTEKQRQWAWFGALWCAGLASAYLIAGFLKLLMHIGR